MSPVGEKMHIHPAHAWFHRVLYDSVGFEHGVVDGFLVFGEFSVDRECAGDVGREAEVFAAHVEEAGEEFELDLEEEFGGKRTTSRHL